MEDFAALAVATAMEKESEGCMMHNLDKVARWALGLLEKTRNKVAVNPFPAGLAINNAVSTRSFMSLLKNDMVLNSWQSMCMSTLYHVLAPN